MRKAALTLLVAATAAVFVGAPGNTAIENETSLITQMTVSATDTFEGDSHTTTASLIDIANLNGDNLVDRVDWTVEADGDDDPEHEWPDNDPGVSSDFDFTYDNLGSTTGAAVVVKAAAFDADGDSDAAQTTINVWTKSETVNIVSKTPDETYVGAIMANIFVQTDVGFYRVDWSVDDGSGGSATAITTNGPGLTSQIVYDFSTVPYGNTVTFTATPYGVNANGEAVAGNAATIRIGVVKAITSVGISHRNDVVAGEEFTLRASTDQPFHTVEWFLGDSEVPIATASSDYKGDRYAAAPYTFQSGQGSSERVGEKHVIRAVAYPLEPGNPRNAIFTATSDERPIFVHEEKGKSCRGVSAYAHGFYIDENHMCVPYWSHGVSYYNDEEDETADLYAFCKMYRLRKGDDGEIPDPVWFRDDEMAHYHAPDGAEDGTPYIINLDLKFNHTITDYYGTDNEGNPHIQEELVIGERYYVVVNTGLNRTHEWDREARTAGVTTVPFEYTGPGWIMPSFHHNHNPTFDIHPNLP